MDFGVYAKQDGIYLRGIAKADTEAEALTTLLRAETMVREALGDYIWGTDEEYPAGARRRPAPREGLHARGAGGRAPAA